MVGEAYQEDAVNHSLRNADPTAHQTSATIAWSATETDAYSEPPFPEDAFCIQMIVLNGERHVYRLNRDTLAQLFSRISEVLAKSPVTPNKDGSLAA